MPPEPLAQEEIESALAELSGWRAVGDGLARTYAFDGHLKAAAMVLHIAVIQEELDHHSEVSLGYREVSVEVTTHSAGSRITELDLRLARRIEAVAAGHGGA